MGLPYREYVGNPHVHSVYSNGTANYRQIATAATTANLDFVIITDHNIRPQGLEGYYGRTLVLSGEELHNVRQHPQANHLLAFGAEREMAPYTFGSTQMLIQTIRERRGINYIAHPVERRSLVGPDLDAIPWTAWPPEGIQGMEIWNYMSEFKGLLWSKPAALIYALRPEWGIRGPYRATLRLWDELLAQGYHIAALGSSAAHGQSYTLGPVTRTIFPYSRLFQCVNTHLLTKGPLTGELERDKTLIYEALQSGRTWVGYDLPYSTRGFRCVFQSGAASAVPGEDLHRMGALNISIVLPARGEIHLLRDGRVVKRATRKHMQHTTEQPGVYRIEAYRKFHGRKVGWIFTSPIYVD